MKRKRIEDRALLDSYHGRECVVCGKTYGTVGHHVKTKKSGGHDIEENLMPLCQVHHNLVHNKGIGALIEKNPLVENWLQTKGWERLELNGKWWNPLVFD